MQHPRMCRVDECGSRLILSLALCLNLSLAALKQLTFQARRRFRAYHDESRPFFLELKSVTGAASVEIEFTHLSQGKLPCDRAALRIMRLS